MFQIQCYGNWKRGETESRFCWRCWGSCTNVFTLTTLCSAPINPRKIFWCTCLHKNLKNQPLQVQVQVTASDPKADCSLQSKSQQVTRLQAADYNPCYSQWPYCKLQVTVQVKACDQTVGLLVTVQFTASDQNVGCRLHSKLQPVTIL